MVVSKVFLFSYMDIVDKRRRFILKSVGLGPVPEEEEIEAGGEENIYMLVLVFILINFFPAFLVFLFSS